MRLNEYEANRIFSGYGLPMMGGYVIDCPDQIADFSGDIVLKAQILSGGRGKAGGIRMASSIQQAKREAKDLLGMDILGHRVNKLFVQNAAKLIKQYYLGYTIDREAGRPIMLFSDRGGVDIEESPDTVKVWQDPSEGFDIEAVSLAIKKVEPKNHIEICEMARRLYDVFTEYDAVTAEINPLALTPQGMMGVDSKMVIDPNALFRHPELGCAEDDKTMTRLEMRACEMGLAYVELEGDIAVIGCGAGLVMASLDAIAEYGGRAANFLDIGGGASQKNMKNAIEISLSKPGIKCLFINIFAGITRCDQIAKAIIESDINVALAIRMMGTNEKEGKKMIEDRGYDTYESMEDAALAAVKACEC